MAAGATYEPIATQTLVSNTSLVTFSSIPATYTDLVMVVNAGAVSANDMYLRLNGDTGSNYSYTILTGNGTSASSIRGSNQTLALVDYYGTPATTLGGSVSIFNFMNYSNTTTNKTILSRSNNASSGTDAIVTLWRSNSAITSMEFRVATNAGVNFLAGSTFTLYGIAAA
jgi:hypothetical protein